MNRSSQFIVVAFGSAGDVYPMAALAKGLQHRGHEVSMLTGGSHLDLIRQLGISVLPMESREKGTEEMGHPNAYAAYSNLWHRIGQAAFVAFQYIQEQVQTADAAGRPRPVLIGSTWAVGARLAQEVFGLPMATLHMSPSCLLSSEQPPAFRDMALPARWPLRLKRLAWWLVETIWLDPIANGHLTPLRKRLKLSPVRRVMGRWMHSPDLVLAMFPDWLASPQADWPAVVRTVGFPMSDMSNLSAVPDELEQFLAGGSPPIVFTTGSAMREAESYFGCAVESCRQLGRRGLLLTRHRDQLPRLPVFMHHESYAPLSMILPRACALVSHAGIGTCSQGLLAGLPQVMLPYAHDQFDNARLFARLGVGQILESSANAPQIADGLRVLLENDAVASACREMQRRMLREPSGIDRACAEIESCLDMRPTTLVSELQLTAGAGPPTSRLNH